MAWNKFHVNLQNLEHQTEKAALIKMPKKSGYSGWMFWHPLSCIHQGKHSYDLVVSFPDTWQFTLIGSKSGDRKEVSHEVMLEAFEGRS